ncbi:NAD(P)H-hydrate epimerase [Poriferisphaera sp. WC338]|uniref:NAD(P)H-hydrate epimerase n=1 Tax=Poriferisphaera sp. WC338 TaxID=3425129 RepID=UPI003D816E0A
MTYLTRTQVRRVDKLAIESLHIPGVALMENAGGNAARIIRKLILPELQVKPGFASVAIICGAGNNGGDGYVIARHLHNHNIDVHLYATKSLDSLTGDAKTNALICRNMKLRITPLVSDEDLREHLHELQLANMIVDAILGTGFEGDVRKPISSLINTLNNVSGPMIVAIDTPSGLDVDTGTPSNATLRAHHTITFVAPKAGFTAESAKPYLGHMHVAPIGVPPSLIKQVLQMD